MIKGRGEGFFARPTARLVVIRTDLDDRRVVRVEVEVVPLDGPQDLLGQRFFGLALEDEGEVHDERLRARLEDAERARGGGRGGERRLELKKTHLKSKNST